MVIKNNLALLTRTKQLSYRALARRTAIPAPYIAQFASGRMVPSDDELLALCKSLEVTVADIYPDAELRRVLGGGE